MIRFAVMRFPVRVEPMFFLIMGFIGFAAGREGLYVVEWIVVAGVGILVHELGHALAFRRYGSQAEIVLHGFGGYTTGNAQPPGRSIVVSVAGPFAGFAVGAVAIWLYNTVGTDSDLVRIALADAIFVTMAWGVLNLLPIVPLDGGNAVKSALEVATGGGGQHAARVISIVTAGGLAVAGVVLGQPFVAMIAVFFGFQSWQAVGRTRDEPDMDRVRAGRLALLQGDAATAVQAAEEVTSQRTSGRVRTAAFELLAWARLAARQPGEADRALQRLGGGVTASQLVRTMVEMGCGRSVPPLAPAFGGCDDVLAATVASRMVAESGHLAPLLDEIGRLAPVQSAAALGALQVGLHRSGYFREAADAGQRLFEREPEGVVAFNVACSWAKVGESEKALSWLSRAVDKGWRDTTVLDSDPSFDPIRATDGYQAVRAWMESGPDAPEGPKGS